MSIQDPIGQRKELADTSPRNDASFMIGYLFCGPRGKPITDMAMTAMFRRRDMPFRPHGFRSSFRSWAEETAQDWTLAETSLAHTIGGRVERSYQRSDLLERRRPLMQEWAQCCLRKETPLSRLQVAL